MAYADELALKSDQDEKKNQNSLIQRTQGHVGDEIEVSSAIVPLTMLCMNTGCGCGSALYTTEWTLIKSISLSCGRRCFLSVGNFFTGRKERLEDPKQAERS